MIAATVAELAVEPQPRAVPDARRALAAALDRAGVPTSAADDACLVLTELLANALKHGTPRADGSLGVGWQIAADEIALEVCDGGPAGADRTPVASPGESGGRGLLLARALSTTVELRLSPDGTTVRATLTR